MEYYDIIERTDKAEPQERQLFLDSCSIIEQAQSAAYRTVNETLIKRNWLLGMRIHHQESDHPLQDLEHNLLSD